MDKLKKCPFCGNKVEARVDTEIDGQDTGYFAVNCDFNNGGCGATGGYRETRKEAIEVWNRRV